MVGSAWFEGRFGVRGKPSREANEQAFGLE